MNVLLRDDARGSLDVTLAYRLRASSRRRIVEKTKLYLTNGVCTSVDVASQRALYADVFHALVGEFWT